MGNKIYTLKNIGETIVYLLIYAILLYAFCTLPSCALFSKPESIYVYKFKMPDAPQLIQELCPDLPILQQESMQISDVINLIADDAELYYNCQDINNTNLMIFNNWYSKNKLILEGK